jgi:predicted nucleic acid-binding protein
LRAPHALGQNGTTRSFVKIYLDLCCLKRPFDDATVLRNHLEAEAVTAILKAVEVGGHTFVRSVAQDAENAHNPEPDRRARVAEWLSAHALPASHPSVVEARRAELSRHGFGPLDASHLAWAEELSADVFVTTDDRLRARASRLAASLKVRVLGPLELRQELSE